VVAKTTNADRPSLKEWTDFVFENCPFDIDEETILIGTHPEPLSFNDSAKNYE